MPDEHNPVDIIATTEEEDTKESPISKVMLVKPLPHDDADAQPEPADAMQEQKKAAPVRKAKPKVGKPASARGRKSGKSAGKPAKKSPKAESREETASMPPAAAPAELPTARGTETAPASALPMRPAETLPAAQTEFPAFNLTPPDMETEHPRPWSFRFILLCVTLFAAGNLGLISIINSYHKKSPTAPAAAAVQEKPPVQGAETGLPALPPPPAMPMAAAPAAASPPATASPLPGNIPGEKPSPTAIEPVAVAPLPPLSALAPAAAPPAAALPAAPLPGIPREVSGNVKKDLPPIVISTKDEAAQVREKAGRQQELLSILTRQ